MHQPLLYVPAQAFPGLVQLGNVHGRSILSWLAFISTVSWDCCDGHRSDAPCSHGSEQVPQAEEQYAAGYGWNQLAFRAAVECRGTKICCMLAPAFFTSCACHRGEGGSTKPNTRHGERTAGELPVCLVPLQFQKPRMASRHFQFVHRCLGDQPLLCCFQEPLCSGRCTAIQL